MGAIKKFRFEILASCAIAVLYLFLRLVNLTSLPIFTDEAIYIRWAQIALQDPNWRFISLSDGKQPLFVWGVALFLKLFEDPLFAGRMVSVVGGAISVVGLWFVTFTLFRNKKIAFLSSLLYVCFPFAQVADRMALYDSLSGAFTIWALYLSIQLVRKVRLDLAYTLGLVIGLGVLNKSTNFFSLYLLPFTAILFEPSKKLKSIFLKWILFVVVAIVVSEGMYGILRLSGLYHMIGLKNALFIYPYSEWITHPFNSFVGNLNGQINWLLEYLKITYLFLIIFAFRNTKFIKEKLLLLIFMILPFLALALFARIIFPRFIFFMTLSLLPLASYGLFDFTKLIINNFTRLGINFGKKIAAAIIILAFISYSLFTSLQFVFDPVNAAIADADNGQYVNNWTAGWGVKESVQFFKSEAENQEIFIGTEGTFGLMPFALEIYLIKNPNIKIVSYWPVEQKIPDQVLEMAKVKKTYFVFYQPNNINPPNPENLKLISKMRAGNSVYFYRVYEVIPNQSTSSQK